mmetsp:Transcript_50222/g.166309  ORF Transcript_50222/g.166309 Transcript_50222/m.166309 type:complete len:267 (+) Transcript_50222:114-914(+)
MRRASGKFLAVHPLHHLVGGRLPPGRQHDIVRRASQHARPRAQEGRRLLHALRVHHPVRLGADHQRRRGRGEPRCPADRVRLARRQRLVEVGEVDAAPRVGGEAGHVRLHLLLAHLVVEEEPPRHRGGARSLLEGEAAHEEPRGRQRAADEAQRHRTVARRRDRAEQDGGRGGVASLEVLEDRGAAKGVADQDGRAGRRRGERAVDKGGEVRHVLLNLDGALAAVAGGRAAGAAQRDGVALAAERGGEAAHPALPAPRAVKAAMHK